jgi:hypothetical membrane protein
MDVKVQSLNRTRIGAALLVLAAVQYLVLEAITAAAWRNPRYDYAVDFISDLGNPVARDVFEGRLITSPLNVVMDVAFVSQGLLFIAAAVLLFRLIGRRLGVVLLVLAVLHGVGVIMVGFFHESAAALTNGVIVFHSLGAASTIVAGNVIAIVIGLAGRGVEGARAARSGRGAAGPGGGTGRSGRTATWYRLVSVALGLLGLAAFVLLMADRHLYDTAGGVPERIAVYTILAWEAATGVALLVRSQRVRPTALTSSGVAFGVSSSSSSPSSSDSLESSRSSERFSA